MERKFSAIAIIYFTIGLFFAFGYALFYHWTPFAFLSPGFYVVILTWPIQVPGFIIDFQQYGFAGKDLLS